jgi:hypothetical protein
MTAMTSGRKVFEQSVAQRELDHLKQFVNPNDRRVIDACMKATADAMHEQRTRTTKQINELDAEVRSLRRRVEALEKRR